MDYQVVLSPSARADLRDIVRYISFDAPEVRLNSVCFLFREPVFSRDPRNWVGSCRSLKTRSFGRPLSARIESFTASTIRAIWSKSFDFGMLPAAHRKSTRDG